MKIVYARKIGSIWHSMNVATRYKKSWGSITGSTIFHADIRKQTDDNISIPVKNAIQRRLG